MIFTFMICIVQTQMQYVEDSHTHKTVAMTWDSCRGVYHWRFVVASETRSSSLPRREGKRENQTNKCGQSVDNWRGSDQQIEDLDAFSTIRYLSWQVRPQKEKKRKLHHYVIDCLQQHEQPAWGDQTTEEVMHRLQTGISSSTLVRHRHTWSM